VTPELKITTHLGILPTDRQHHGSDTMPDFLKIEKEDFAQTARSFARKLIIPFCEHQMGIKGWFFCEINPAITHHKLLDVAWS